MSLTLRIVSLIFLANVGYTRTIAGVRGGVTFYEDELRRIRGETAGFDYLMLTMIYPEAVCRADDDTVPESCEIPDGTPKWSIHGLWPNYNNGSYPQFCDGTPKKFDVHGIQPILEDLKLNWPNLYPTKSQESFWKHEWEKHGTCSERDQRLNSELKYFNSTLTLHNAFDVERSLNDQGVLPSLDGYTYDQIMQGFKAGLSKGKNVQFNCLTDKKTKQSLLGDVRLCFDLDLNLRDCPVMRSNMRVTTRGRGPPLPGFKPCRGLITYLPSQQEEAIEKFSNVVITIHPAAMVLSIINPVFALFLASILLLIVIYALGQQNLELMKNFRATIRDRQMNYRRMKGESAESLPQKEKK